MAKQREKRSSLVVGVGRGSVLLKRYNDLMEAMHITHEEVQAAIERNATQGTERTDDEDI